MRVYRCVPPIFSSHWNLSRDFARCFSLLIWICVSFFFLRGFYFHSSLLILFIKFSEFLIVNFPHWFSIWVCFGFDYTVIIVNKVFVLFFLVTNLKWFSFIPKFEIKTTIFRYRLCTGLRESYNQIKEKLYTIAYPQNGKPDIEKMI